MFVTIESFINTLFASFLRYRHTMKNQQTRMALSNTRSLLN